MNGWLIVLVGAGGAIGTLIRYGVGRAMAAKSKPSHYGTLIVNIVGSFAMGLLLGFGWERDHDAVYAFAAVGMLGGLTTYSTLNVQKASMLRDGARRPLAIYLAATYVGGFAATAAGFLLARLVMP